METISFRQYISAFEVFGQYTEEYRYQLEHLLHTSEQLVKEGFSVLDIGAGTGFFVKEFLDAFKVTASSYTAIEPSKTFVERIKKNFRGTPFEVNIYNDSFTPRTDLGRKFDLIIMSQVLGWFVPDPEPYVLNAQKYLKEKGAMIFYLQTPYGATHILNLLLRDALPKNRVPNHTLNSWALMDIFDKNNLRYNYTSLSAAFNADALFEKSNKRLLKELMCFFLSVKSLDSKTFERAEEALHKLSYHEGNNLKFSSEVAAITAF